MRIVIGKCRWEGGPGEISIVGAHFAQSAFAVPSSARKTKRISQPHRRRPFLQMRGTFTKPITAAGAIPALMHVPEPNPPKQLRSSHRPSNGDPPSPIPPADSMHPVQILTRYITWSRPVRGHEEASPCCLCFATRFVSRRRDYN